MRGRPQRKAAAHPPLNRLASELPSTTPGEPSSFPDAMTNLRPQPACCETVTATEMLDHSDPWHYNAASTVENWENLTREGDAMTREIEWSSMVRVIAVTLVAACLGGAVTVEAAKALGTDADAEAGMKTESSVSSSDDVDSDAAAQTSTSSSIGGMQSKFQIHGFLTQAYAVADFTTGGPNSDEIAIGIPEQGTTDYRFLALQFRYQMTDKDLMVVQLSSRALGESPIELVEDEIELDFAFYERRLADNTSIKVGRIQIPLGIFNEFRDVGPLLPFYRPPYTFYREGTFTSETVDGALLSHTFWASSDWSLEADLYAGEWDLVELSVFDPRETPKIAHTKDSFGTQLWLNTPIRGLRLGVGFQRRNITGGQEGVFRAEGERSRLDDYFFSLEGNFTRFVVRAEWRKYGGPFVSPQLGFTSRGFNENYYLQLGYHFTEKFRIYGQTEFAGVKNHSDFFTQESDIDFRTDDGLAINYAFSPTVVLKAEYHWYDGEISGFVPVVTPDGLRLQPTVIEFNDGTYSILSLAVSF